MSSYRHLDPEERMAESIERAEEEMAQFDIDQMLADESRDDIDDLDLIDLACQAASRYPTDPLVRLAIDSVLRGANA